ncbi:MAG TPA: substrate-binding domain-containing protein [Nodosilinea sp.]|nr:substrate-binding domain-containing protein [Nodosilinea sp.]
MNLLRKPSLAMLTLFSALAALPLSAIRSEPRLLAQVTAEPTPTFTLQETVAPGTTIAIEGSSSMAGINQSLEESFEQRYPDTDVVLATSDDDQALQALREGRIDLAALGRSLSADEQDPSLTSIPVTREKIAIIVGRDNPFRGDLTFEQFAAIFRGEITNWSQVGGPNVPLRLIDRPATSATRLALADYEIFKSQPFETGTTAVPVEEDDTVAVVRELGNDGLSYAIASEVLNQDAVRPVSMDGTLPDDPRYPYSQPRNYIYRGEPSLPVEAFLGFATNAEGQAAVAEAKQTASDNLTVGANKLPGGVALAPAGDFMVRGTETGQLQWLDAQGNPTGDPIDAHRGAVSAVGVSPDGQTVVSSGADGTLRRWDRNGTSLGDPLIGRGGPILALALSPDGQTLASGHADGTVERWSLADGTSLGAPIPAHDAPVQAIHFPAGGQGFITGSSDGSLGFWNTDGTAASQATSAHPGGVTAITSSPDGQVLTTTGGDGSLRNWDRATLQPRGETLQAHGDAVSAVAYAADGNTLATAGADGTLQLWGADGRPRLPEPIELDAPAASLGFTPEGQLVVGSSDLEVELRNAQGELVDAADPSADPSEPATDLGDFWQRLQNLPPSAWWMLAAIPAVLLLAGLVGSLFGSKDRDEEDDDEVLEADLSPGPGSGIDFSEVGKPAVVVSPERPGDQPPGGELPGDQLSGLGLPGAELPGLGPSGDEFLPPEVALVPAEGEYPGPATPNKLEQARIDLAEGRRLMREGRYDEALIYFSQAVEATEVERVKAESTGVPAQGINAIAAQAQAQRGNALALLGQADEAMDSYNAALQLDTSVVEAWIGKGRLLTTLGRYEEALFCFDSALELDQAAGDAWLGKSQALQPMGRQAEAQAALARATALGSSDSSLMVPVELPYPTGEAIMPGPGIVPGPAPGPLPEYGLPEYESTPGYDPDIPLELQQMVLGLPSADAVIESLGAIGSLDVPPALAEQAAGLPGQAEAATSGSSTGGGSTGGGSMGTLPITPGPLVPAEVPSGAISPGPAEPEILETTELGAIAPGPVPSTLEEELLSQVSLGAGDLTMAAPMTPTPIAPTPIAPTPMTPTVTDQGMALGEAVPPLRPAPTPVPPPVPVQPGDYIPPPPAVVGSEASDLEGLPPEVIAALSSIPPSSPDSFGVVPASAATATPAVAEPLSWIRLSVDRETERFYAVWQLDDSDRSRAKQQGGEIMTLRLYDVTGRATSAPLPEAVVEQRCRDDFAQDWYLPIPQHDRIYVVEVGYLNTAGDDWQALAQSVEVAAITG